MTLPEEALQKLTKYELVNLSLKCQNKFNSTLANIDKDMVELRNDFKSLWQTWLYLGQLITNKETE